MDRTLKDREEERGEIKLGCEFLELNSLKHNIPFMCPDVHLSELQFNRFYISDFKWQFSVLLISF